MPEPVDLWATRFLAATDQPHFLPRPSKTGFTGGLDEAYLIQQATLDLRLARGEQLRAIKLGLADPAEQRQWNIPHPTWGSLTDSMLLDAEVAFSCDRGIAPRVEAEVVVILGKTLTEAPATPEDFLGAISGVHAGIEILDSRFEEGAFDPLDAVADNQSALSGTWSNSHLAPDWRQLAHEEAVLSVNGEAVQVSRDASTRPHPLESAYRAILDRITRGLAVPAGLAIFTGNILPEPAVIGAGDRIQVVFTTLGTAAIDVVA